MSEPADIAPGITVDKKVGFGKPVIQGTGITVADILARLAAAATYEQIERDCRVSRDAILAAVSYAAEIIADERISVYGDRAAETVELSPGITADRRVRFGRPVLEGTRVDAATILNHLAAGDSLDVVAEAYAVPRSKVLAALGYAHAVVSSETVSTI